MHTFKIVVLTIAGVVLIVSATAASAIYYGVYNVGASNHHLAATYWLLNQARKRSVVVHSDSIKPPPLGSRKQLLVGAAHFQAMCSGCHMPPGAHETVAAKGMYPSPPNLSESGKEMPASQIFWTIKHGITASGMPAWGVTHDDHDLWALTALVKQFPDMSNADYRHLVQTAKSKGIKDEDMGHDHGSGSTHSHGTAAKSQ